MNLEYSMDIIFNLFLVATTVFSYQYTRRHRTELSKYVKSVLAQYTGENAQQGKVILTKNLIFSCLPTLLFCLWCVTTGSYRMMNLFIHFDVVNVVTWTIVLSYFCLLVYLNFEAIFARLSVRLLGNTSGHK